MRLIRRRRAAAAPREMCRGGAYEADDRYTHASASAAGSRRDHVVFLGTRRREEPFMKRLAVLLVIVVISMLVVVASASAATTLQGKFTGGVATQDHPAFTDDTGYKYPHTVNLVAGGPVSIAIGAPQEVSGELKISGTDLGPFFGRANLNLGQFFAWDPGAWNKQHTVYTVTGTVGEGIPGVDPRFDATLKMPTTPGAKFTMYVEVTASFYNWDYWNFWGVVQ
jgi:hypothetical protein